MSPHSVVLPTEQIDPTALKERFHENRKRFPAEELAAYAGKMVAWWPS